MSLLWNAFSDYSCTTKWKSGMVWSSQKSRKSKRVLLIGHSSDTNFTKFSLMFDKHFSKFYPLSFGTGGDKIQNALWRINNMSLPPSLHYIFIHSGTSDIRHNDSEVISDGLINLKELTKYLRLTLLFMWNGEQREKFNFCFSRFFI